ncbi:hypothetical protein [Novosphingobium sp. CECT 9465]|uniref:hypothetical protein n=1 Tax=Novosphingobium sp. CECT 9465 TaxID=2829794 RepID=UPI001E4200F7|nr:hypothetical protein [Novosphingobium sp. CECT 9465]CAH0496369.1 hypothetical protein NVSP9465_01401 [Novosphingobium sp. CECT 9465]
MPPVPDDERLQRKCSGAESARFFNQSMVMDEMVKFYRAGQAQRLENARRCYVVIGVPVSFFDKTP